MFRCDNDHFDYIYDVRKFMSNLCKSIDSVFADDESIVCRIAGDRTLELLLNGKKMNVGMDGKIKR